MAKKKSVEPIEEEPVPVPEEEVKEEVKEEVEGGAPPPAPKKKRAPSAYNMFIKENAHKVSDLPSKERFKALSVMWKKHKEGPPPKKAKKSKAKK